jgi:hypothetical protein
MNQVINAFTMPPWRSIYRAVRGLVYTVKTTPNYHMNRVEYKITWSLQSFLNYNYFRAEPI